jgi:DNA-binding winged helix-turn-helix (wHTH) protein
MQVRFGEFTLDTESRQLLRHSAERHLSPKAFDLLYLLIQSRPRALSKAELHERLWPSTFVSDATLSSLVAEVRAALDENAHRGRFVRTVHRFGYAFKGTASGLATHAPTPDQRPRCCVIWEWGQVALREGDHLLGRAGDVAVWLESPTVSRHHARIRVRGLDVTIEDLASKNGTFVRGQPLTGPTPVTDGDEIELGSVPVKVRLFDPSGSTETRPSGERRRHNR